MELIRGEPVVLDNGIALVGAVIVVPPHAVGCRVGVIGVGRLPTSEDGARGDEGSQKAASLE